jgi:hypothetical protein
MPATATAIFVAVEETHPTSRRPLTVHCVGTRAECEHVAERLAFPPDYLSRSAVVARVEPLSGRLNAADAGSRVVRVGDRIPRIDAWGDADFRITGA